MKLKINVFVVLAESLSLIKRKTNKDNVETLQ